MSYSAVALLLLFSFLNPGFATLDDEQEPVLVLSGLDPIHLSNGTRMQGQNGLTVDHGKFRYRFSTAEHRNLFLEQPEKYAVQMGGACPVRPDLPGNPELFVVHEGRIYLFFTEHCRHKFLESPGTYL